MGTVTRGSAARRPAPVLLALAVGLGLIGGCTSPAQHPAAHPAQRETDRAGVTDVDRTPSRPPPLNVYAHIAPGMMNPRWARDPYRIYVPNSLSDTVTEINPQTHKIIRTFAVGGQPNHITPSWDGSVLWVNDTDGYSLTPIDPKTAARRPVPSPTRTTSTSPRTGRTPW